MRLLRVLWRIEALKTVKRPAFWVTIVVYVAFTASVIPQLARNARRAGDGFAFPDAWRSIVEPAINLGPVFLAALMILLFAPEFRWKTARQNVIDGLGKEQFYWGKVLVLGALAALFLVVPIVVGVAQVVAGSGEGGATLFEPMDLNYLLGFVVALLLWGSGGFMLAAMIRGAGPALGLLFIYFFCEQLVVQLVRDGPAVLDFLPIALFTTIVDSKLHYPLLLARENVARAERGADPLVFPDVWVPLVAAMAYIAIFLGLAFVNMRRRDL